MSTSALYYPYTTVRSLDSLKAMILYFDTINIIKPVGPFREDGVSAGNTRSIFPQISELEHKQIVRYISPSTLLRDYDEIITKSMIGDLVDPVFLKLCQKKDTPSSFEIYADKIPNLWINNFFQNRFDIPGMYITNHFGRKRFGPRLGLITLPFRMGESLMINHALCACDKFSLTPITDHSIHNDFLMYKFRKLQNSALVRRILSDYGYTKDMRINLTSVEIISETVPTLCGANMVDVLEFRDSNKDALERFKMEMGRVVTEVEGNFWDEDFYKKIVDIIDSKVKPAIKEIKDSVESVREKFLRILRKGVTISPLPIVANVVPGLDPATALMASAGIVALDEFLESSIKRRNIRKNGFAYLFEAQKKF